MTPQQKKRLKAQAHQLKPVVMIGQSGLTNNVLSAIEVALTDHELIKIKINADRDTQQQMVEKICAELGAHHVQSIGRVSVIYRENPVR